MLVGSFNLLGTYKKDHEFSNERLRLEESAGKRLGSRLYWATAENFAVFLLSSLTSTDTTHAREFVCPRTRESKISNRCAAMPSHEHSGT